MEIELSIQPNQFLSLSSFEKQQDSSGSVAIRLVSGNFTYQTNEFYFDDFSGFVSKLKSMNQNLKGEAELRFHYESEHIKFAAKPLGKIVMSGVFIEYGSVVQRMEFGFEFDQSYLSKFIGRLNEVQQIYFDQ